MSHSHMFEICRALYQITRQNGSPPVYVIDLGCGVFCGETKDGVILVEGITNCCKWAMKHEIAQMWLDHQASELTHHTGD